MKQILSLYILLIFTLFLSACEKDDDGNNTPPDNNGSGSNGTVVLTTDKARYNPGEEVTITSDKMLSGDVKVRYRHLGETISEETFSADSWRWNLPNEDFKGYMVDVYEEVDGEEVVYGSVAVDASSDWTVFPRYGFLSEFSSEVTQDDVDKTLSFLNRCHINGIQYYDWLNKHHWPLKMNGNEPAATWLDIAKREVAFNTVDTYIKNAKSLNMASMEYNLLFGAWDDYESDGVSTRWMLFSDQNHQYINKHDLDESWAMSDILLANPHDANWQDYIFEKTAQVYEHLDFDGWHVDQLGNRGDVYDYDGNRVDLPSGYQLFMSNLKTRFPDKKMALNAVDQYGQQEIMDSGVDFAYSEIWSYNSFEALSQVILDNYRMGGESRNTVLAAYMNYDLSHSAGYFNTPAVLLADAVIFAFGGSHLELGEHMLANEYFPNNNLLMRTDLKDGIVNYYDFLVAYQNLLRGGGEFNSPELNSLDGQRSINSWPPQTGKIAAIGKLVEGKQVMHLLNFTNSNSLLWRDNSGNQKYPDEVKDLRVEVHTDKVISKVWFASPDFNGGVMHSLDFEQSGNYVTVTIPKMQYWGMVVME
ncbi:glycoside hydrolase family 66 protein [Marinilabilia sp.]|uniref:glycoside hydrolase family 66 protein n=1 Tax=Marinilabilia sp. TaxID=2021252 RepID=UPI0025C13757|nr:glycoside hydrolase family 66 protein [Marinilabilia sp.]